MKRWEIINSLIEKHGYKSYIELGVHQKECFNKIMIDFKECVDPMFEADYEMTSDEFFRDHARYADIWFIDGLHTADQTYQDMVNAYHYMNIGGVIVVHDCNPISEWHTRPPEEYTRGEEWNGETYKGYLRFKRERFDLECFVVDCDYGCGVIREKIPKVNTFTDWDSFDQNRKELLGLISVDEYLNLS